MTDKICLAISGTHGSGTSSAAKKIAEILNLKLVSAGTVFRESAKKRGYTDISNFIEIVEGDSELKDELDETIRREAEKGDVIIEGRIVCWTAKEFAHLRVMLDAPIQTRIARIATRPGKSIETAKAETERRESEENEWFLKKRGVNLNDLSIFDIIINTERISREKVVDLILSAIQKKIGE